MRYLLILLALNIIVIPATAGDRVYQYATAEGVPLFTDRHTSIGNALVTVTFYGRPPPPAVTGGCRLSSSKTQKRIQRYAKTIARLSTTHNIDQSLIEAVIAAESCYNPKAVSRVGAQGLMQLMPKTATMLGVKDSFNPEQNMAGGVQYLRMMLDEFDQDKRLALAAYNAGPNAVKKYKNTVPPYKETRNYVRKIMKMIH